jgi:hypothetical protein
MSKVLLSDEKIETALTREDWSPSAFIVEMATEVAKAQLKAVVEWLEEDCPHPADAKYLPRIRRDCFACWAELKASIKE